MTHSLSVSAWDISAFTLFAPFIPFIAEEIYQCRSWSKDNGSVHTQLFPNVEDYTSQTGNIALYDKVVECVELGRKIKAEEKRSLRTPVLEMTVSANEKTLDLLHQAQIDLENVLNIKEHKITFEAKSDEMTLMNFILGEDEKKVK